MEEKQAQEKQLQEQQKKQPGPLERVKNMLAMENIKTRFMRVLGNK